MKKNKPSLLLFTIAHTCFPVHNNRVNGRFVLLLFMALLLHSCNQLPSTNQLFKITALSERPLSYNSNSVAVGGGKWQAEFHTRWINYMDDKHQWQKIDPNFVKTERGFEMTKAPFEVVAPLYADEAAIFNNNNRYDIFTKKMINDKPLEQTIQALGTEHVMGMTETGDLGWGEVQYVIYPNAYPQYHADLIYWVHQGRAPRLRKFIRFNVKLTADADFQFRIIYSGDVETVNNGSTVSVRSKDAKGDRGNGWSDFYIWDAKDGWAKRQPIRFGFEHPSIASAGDMATDQREYILTKHIESGYFKTAALPVFTDATITFSPNPHTETTSVDGQTGNNGIYTVWSDIHSTANGNDADNTSNILYCLLYINNNNTYYISRSFTLFDTSPLDDNATINSATYSIYVNQKWNDDNASGNAFLNVVQTTPSSNTAIVLSDYSKCGSVDNPTLGAANLNLSSITAPAYNNFTLNATGLGWISKTGITKLGFRDGHDINNIALPGGPQHYSGVSAASAETGLSTEPKLLVNYTLQILDTATVNWNNGNVEEIILATGRAFKFTNGKSGGIYNLLIKQDGTGGWGVSWPTNVKWAGGIAPTLTTTAGAVDMVRFIYDGTNYLGNNVTLNIK